MDDSPPTDFEFASPDLRSQGRSLHRSSATATEHGMRILLADQHDLSLLRRVEDLRWRVSELENRLTRPLDPPSSTSSFLTATRSIRRSRSAEKRSTIANQLLEHF
jgi:hypothetical protein